MSEQTLSNEDMRYGEKLGLLMASRRLSQDEMVQELGNIVSKSTIRRWIEGASLPRLDEAMAVAGYFDVTLESLAYDAYDAPAPAGAIPEERIVLSDDERTVLNLYRDLGLERPPVVRAMHALAAIREIPAGAVISSTSRYSGGGQAQPGSPGAVPAATDAAPEFPERRSRSAGRP